MIPKIKVNAFTRTLKVLVIIPSCVILVLAPYSLLLGWDMITALLFWFIIVPGIILYLSSKIFKAKNAIADAMLAMVVFYSFMVFMIYKHYQSDLFKVMMASFIWNLLIMILVMFIERQDKIAARGRTARD